MSKYIPLVLAMLNGMYAIWAFWMISSGGSTLRSINLWNLLWLFEAIITLAVIVFFIFNARPPLDSLYSLSRTLIFVFTGINTLVVMGWIGFVIFFLSTFKITNF